MKNVKRLFLSALLLFVLAMTVAMPVRGGNEASLKVMSFNIRTLMLTDGLDYWAFRKGEVAKLVKRHSPDLIGLQEVYSRQAIYLDQSLPKYKWFGVARDDGKVMGERCPIFYRKDRFKLISHDTFWLSETPDVPGSRGWDAACNRIVTWGEFKDLQSGERFFLFNTHFDHMGRTAREESAKLLKAKTDEIAGGAKVIVTGDFNSTDDSEPYSILTSFFEDARELSEKEPMGPYGTSRGFGLNSQVRKRIDYVFVNGGLSVLSYKVIDDTYGEKGRRPSDHMPVLVKVALSD